MTRRRRTLLIALALLVLALVLAPAALAAAGGGSSGFGGGGEGGGGRGAGLYILVQILLRIAILWHGLGLLVVLGLIVLALLVTKFVPQARSFWSAQEAQGRARRRQTAQRERRVELAAAEAAEEDPSFAPENVRAAATRLFEDIERAWDANDRSRLRALVAPGLFREWERRLNDFQRRGWRNRVQPLGPPSVEYVGLTRTGDDAEDRAVVRIEARIRDYVEDRHGNRLKRLGRLSETMRMREYWTLSKRDGRWVLASIEQGGEGEHALGEEIVATPWSDERRMRDDSLVERAVAEALPDGVSVAEVADLDFQRDARAAALDLSIADGRFAPDVLEVAARRAVAAWTAAVDGEEAQLHSIAAPQAVEALLHPGDDSARTRLVVRGPVVRHIRIRGLEAGAEPPTMTIEVELEGRRYLEDRDTGAVLAGSAVRSSRFTERWTLALDGDGAQPWRLTSVGQAIQRI